LYKLLNKFNKVTNIPILVNTSFNQHDEPIIETPKEAIEMFLSTELDYLIIWDYMVFKKKVFSEFTFSEEKSYWKLFNIDDRILEKLNKDIKEKIINNLKINKNFISKLLLTYYNDFVEENNVVDIIITNNNFKL
jgi:hypothetical protein